MDNVYTSPLQQRLLSLLMATALLTALLALRPHTVLAGEQTEIRLIVGAESFPAILEDNSTSRDFLKMLPLTLIMKDYNKTEKTGDLPRTLTTEGAPDGFDPAAGDLTVYAPWGNLAIFYKDYSWSKGLIRLGRIPLGIEKLATMRDNMTITFERVE